MQVIFFFAEVSRHRHRHCRGDGCMDARHHFISQHNGVFRVCVLVVGILSFLIIVVFFLLFHFVFGSSHHSVVLLRAVRKRYLRCHPKNRRCPRKMYYARVLPRTSLPLLLSSAASASVYIFRLWIRTYVDATTKHARTHTDPHAWLTYSHVSMQACIWWKTALHRDRTYTSGMGEWKSESVVKFGPSVGDAVNMFVSVHTQTSVHLSFSVSPLFAPFVLTFATHTRNRSFGRIAMEKVKQKRQSWILLTADAAPALADDNNNNFHPTRASPHDSRRRHRRRWRQYNRTNERYSHIVTVYFCPRWQRFRFNFSRVRSGKWVSKLCKPWTTSVWRQTDSQSPMDCMHLSFRFWKRSAESPAGGVKRGLSWYEGKDIKTRGVVPIERQSQEEHPLEFRAYIVMVSIPFT